MTHKYTYILLAIACFSTSSAVLAQSYNKLLELGNKEYDRGNYYTSAGYYEEVVKLAPGVPSLKFRLGEALMNAKCLDKAERIFKEVADNAPLKFPLAIFYDAELLKMQGRYDEAIVQYRYFYKNYSPGAGYSDKARNEIIACDFAKKSRANTNIPITKLAGPANTMFNELSISEFDDSVLLYSSMVPNADTILFLSRFFFSKHVFKYELLARRINEIGGNIADLSLAAGHTTAYFSHCPDTAANYLCSIYSTSFVNNEWSEPQLLPDIINMPGTSNSQPFVTTIKGGTYLFFASNRIGGKGKLDIWHSEITEGQFSPPQNEGEIINTPGDEVCPFYDTVDSRLFFSSDWHKGFGGFDIYFSNGVPGSWTNPLKEGLFVNSSYNDLYFSISQDHKKAYFTSNRDITPFMADTFHFNDFYSFKLPFDVADSSVSSKALSTANSNQQKSDKNNAESIKSQLNFYYPLQLYFDHDQPGVAMYSFQVTDFGSLVRDYINRKYVYQHEYEKIKTLMPKLIVGKEINDFFINDIEKNYLKLDESMKYILDLVKLNQNVTILIKAYTSPSGNEEYNNLVAKRRENSIINYYRSYQNGAMIPYINKSLFFKTLPPVIQVEDQQIDKTTPEYQYSKYSTRSAFERRVDVQVILK